MYVLGKQGGYISHCNGAILLNKRNKKVFIKLNDDCTAIALLYKNLKKKTQGPNPGGVNIPVLVAQIFWAFFKGNCMDLGALKIKS